jgi:tripartite-type tricarboxylate transporter receptor subunit TctC
MHLSRYKPAFGPLTRRGFLYSSAAVAMSAARPVWAADYPHLSGRTVTMVIGSDLGGGYDLFGRVLARHLELAVKDLRVNIQNVGQAGGKLAAKMVQEGPTDGSMIAVAPSGLMSAQFLEDEGVAYDVATWSWLGKLTAESRLFLKGPGANFTGILDLQADRAPATLSVRSTSSFAYYETLWINAMLRTHIKPIPGYKGGEKEAAVVSGEIMMTTASYPDDLKIMESPGIEVALRVNDTKLPAPYDKAPTLNALRGASHSYDGVARFLEANYELARWVVAPPNVEAGVLEDWRAAFDATVVSPAFLADTGKLDIAVQPMSGAPLAQRITDMLADQKSLRAELQAALNCGKALSEGQGGACRQS